MVSKFVNVATVIHPDVTVLADCLGIKNQVTYLLFLCRSYEFVVLCFALIIATSGPLCSVHFSESRNTVCGPVCHTSVFHWLGLTCSG